MKRYIIFLFILFPIITFSQNISGKIFGNGDGGKQPLPGVNIYWEGTTEGTASNSEGDFEISQKTEQHMLVFSFVGYSTQVLHVHGSEPIEVTLEPNLEIEEVTVVKKDRGTYLSTINPVHTVRIGGAELHKAACCNLAESFETNPSVDVSYSDAVTGAKQIRLLGLEGTYSQLQIENMPNLRGLATNFGLTYIPGPWMESIQVSKGAASVLNGYESISGQINAEYKKPDSQEKLFLNVYAGGHGRLEFNGNTNIRVHKDKLTTGLFVHASDLSKRNDDNGDGFLDTPLSRLVQVLNRWKYNNFKGFMAQAGISMLAEDRLGGQVGFERGMNSVPTNPYGININTKRFEGFFKTGFVTPNGRTAVAFLSNFASHFTESFYGLNNFDADETRFYGNFVLTRDLDEAGFHSLNSGFGFIFDKFNEELYGQSMNRTEQVPGIFAEYTMKPSENFTLMTGIRADFHNIFGAFVTPRMHLRFQASDNITLRMNAGKGYRTANVVSENIFLLASARQMDWSDNVFQEEAWNFGFSFIQNYQLFNRDLQINAEYFYTDFQSQLVIDRETSSSNIILSPLNGKSYAGSLQFDLRYQLIERLDILLAYRINDVKQTISGELLEKPLTNRYKGLINFNYSTNLKKWMFDYTIQFNGGGRIPRYPVEGMDLLQVSADYYEFSPYTVMNAQVTKYFRYWSIYAGSENLTNFKQKNPIAGADNPFGPDFDATNVWGPTLGRKIYMGLRFNLNYE
ncbi:MAG: TonB-dependent receptor [Prolixibacteraceae bacterium]|jgi:outer membrane receptor for ferrienterochelin and colicins|nr:TonB-dependent receptor [Prolixibacteraceae bacterium]MBT6007206.1 TonB-dependent receptor [Prolixibacteraceae bacterium]MBT6765967.1 TonB-dependent receptor [Prolixibacteraceae bacterium]MBT7000895.1 TonB-dependent receptor [Prolixibacteraceae bacterium]MBT7397174.1 TonB-dependent receptor [Prolixibacteraceae bacterium]